MEPAITSSIGVLNLARGLKPVAAVVFVAGTLATGYQATLTPVTLVVDGEVQRLRTHQESVGGLLMDAGVALHAEDIITPPLDWGLEPGLTVQVEPARLVRVSADGHEFTLRTHAASVEAVLAEVGLALGPRDEVEVEGEFPRDNPEPARITVRRAVRFTVHEGGRATTVHTTAATVGEALREAGLTLYLADRIRPGQGERMSAGLHVYVERSTPVTVQVDGRIMRTRTHRERVGEVLADLSLILTGQDYTMPMLDSPLEEASTIRVVRVSERFVVEQEPIPFESVWQADPDLEIDHLWLLQEGAPGVRERRIGVRYEDDHEVARAVENEYVAVRPTTRIKGYGTKIVVRTLDTPSGPVEYWRVLPMLATSYSASTAGTPQGSRWFGRTAIGMKMRKGIVAVDPRVVDLHSRVYVPGYGVGIAGDTGGAIKGRRVDLGYDDDRLELWYRWVDVYLLTPVPSPDRIDYTLP